MQRQLLKKLLSKIPQNAHSISRNSSSFLETNSNPFVRDAFYQYSTLTRSNLGKINSQFGVSGKIRNSFYSNSVPVRSFFSGVLFKGKSSSFVNYRVWNQLRRKFHSFDSQYRGGWRSYNQRLEPDQVVIGIIVINVAVFMLWGIANRRFMVDNFMISLDNFKSGRLHTLITSAFSHREMGHLVVNMLGLFFFGTSVGRIFGTEYLLKLYMSGALAGSIFYLANQAFIAQSYQGSSMWGLDPSRVPGLGASGAVNAVMLLDIFLNPKKTIFLNFLIPVPAILVGIFMIGTDLWRMMGGDHEVSGSAHLGGAFIAVVAWLRSRKGRFRRF